MRRRQTSQALRSERARKSKGVTSATLPALLRAVIVVIPIVKRRQTSPVFFPFPRLFGRRLSWPSSQPRTPPPRSLAGCDASPSLSPPASTRSPISRTTRAMPLGVNVGRTSLSHHRTCWRHPRTHRARGRRPHHQAVPEISHHLTRRPPLAQPKKRFPPPQSIRSPCTSRAAEGTYGFATPNQERNREQNLGNRSKDVRPHGHGFPDLHFAHPWAVRSP